MIYVLMFVTSLFFLKIACIFRKNNKLLFLLFSIIGILLPCLLAAFRDLSIGTDIKVYIQPLFNSASWYSDFYTYFLHPNSSINDILYLLLTFICQHLSKNISFLFFMIELLVVVPIYLTLLRSNKESNNIILGMFIFYMFFYNATFNMARQSIALAFSVLAMTYLNEKKDFKFILLSIIAYLFHSSAIVMLLIYIFYKYKNNIKIYSFKKSIVEFLIIIAIMCFILFLPKILSIFISLGFDSLKFNSILTKYSMALDINWVNTLFYVYICLIINLNEGYLKNKMQDFAFYKFMSFICIFVLQLGAVIKYSDRIGYYAFYPVLFIVLPKLAPASFRKITKQEFRNLILITAVFIIYWLFWIVIQNYHETFPYVFYNS